MEMEEITSIRRATYVSNNIKFKRRKDLEMTNGHMIVIDVIRTMTNQIVDIYRPFNPSSMSEWTFFTNQLSKLKSLSTKNTIILGDFNLTKEDVPLQACNHDVQTFQQQLMCGWIHPLNFQLYDNARSKKLVFSRRHNYDVGKNILLDILCSINNVIDRQWLNLGLDSYKIKWKQTFLNWLVDKMTVATNNLD